MNKLTMSENQVKRENGLSRQERNEGYSCRPENGQANDDKESHNNIEICSRREKLMLEEDLTKLAVVIADKQAKVQGTTETVQDFQNNIKFALDRIRIELQEPDIHEVYPAEVINWKELKEEIRLKMIEVEKREELQVMPIYFNFTPVPEDSAGKSGVTEGTTKDDESQPSALNEISKIREALQARNRQERKATPQVLLLSRRRTLQA